MSDNGKISDLIKDSATKDERYRMSDLAGSVPSLYFTDGDWVSSVEELYAIIQAIKAREIEQTNE